MTKHRITAEQVKKIEDALEERKRNGERRRASGDMPAAAERRGEDRRNSRS